LKLLLNIRVYFNLMEQKDKEANMKMKLRKGLRCIGEKIITLNIQENRYITFIPHSFINFLNFKIDIDLLLLLLQLNIEIIFFQIFQIFIFMRGLIRFRDYCSLGNNFIFTHITLITSKRLNKAVFTYNLIIFTSI